MKSLIISLLIFSSLTNLLAQESVQKKLDDLITARYSSISPGCVVLAAKKGKVIYEKAFGSANLELDVPMQPGMIFRIGSITKQFTAVAILQLIEQGKIALTDSIQYYIKSFPTKNHTITIENLLTHTSGLIDYQAIKDTLPPTERRDYTPAEGINYLKNEPLLFTPGSQFSYSNSNFFLLGYIIELVSGKRYADYIKENIIDKIGLTNTFYNNQEKIIHGRVAGYTMLSKELENPDFVSMSIVYAAGALLSNAADLFKWQQALNNGNLLTKKTIEKAWSPFILDNGKETNYGYGWYLRNIAGSRTIEHGGAIDGFRADEIYLVDEDIYITTLFNCLAYNEDWMILTNDIGRILLDKPIRVDLNLPEDLLKKYTGSYDVKEPINNEHHVLTVRLEKGKLSVVSANPKDRLPKVRLYAENENTFYMQEASLRFQFVPDGSNFKLVILQDTKVNGELIRIK